MILADTSVWIDHLRKTDALLASLLNTVQIVIHPFIIVWQSQESERAALLAEKTSCRCSGNE